MSTWTCDSCPRVYVEEPGEEILAEWLCLADINGENFIHGTCTGTMHKVTANDGEVKQ